MVLASHLGRPKGKPDKKYSLEPVAARLAELLGADVALTDEPVGDGARKVVDDLRAGAVALLENLRFSPGEEANDEGFARALASYADVYVNDAFGTAHRAHASTVGIAKFVADKGIGLLMEREVKFLGRLLGDVERPFVAIIGGAKVSDKIGVLENLLGRVDQLLIGGAMANTFLKAKGGKLGRSLVEDDKLALARAFLKKAEEANVDVLLPRDVVGGGRHQVRVGPRRAGDGRARGSRGARHRPGDGARLRRRDRARQDHLLERPDGRVRVRAVRGGHAGGRAGGRRGAGRAVGRRRRRLGRGGSARAAWPTRSRTSRPAAAPRSSSSRARSCPASPRWRARRIDDGHDATPILLRKLEAATARSPSRWRSRPTCVTASPPVRDVDVGGRAQLHRALRGRQAAGGRSGRPSPRRTASGRTRARSPARSRRRSSPTPAASYVIVGHSERRQLFGELDAAVNLKARAALRAGLSPIICVGETLAERDAGETIGRVQAQLDAALVDIDDAEPRARASSPTSRSGRSAPGAPRPRRRRRRCTLHPRAARGRAAAAVAATAAHPVRRQREAGQRRALMAEADIDGALVGGASLVRRIVRSSRQEEAARTP